MSSRKRRDHTGGYHEAHSADGAKVGKAACHAEAEVVVLFPAAGPIQASHFLVEDFMDPTAEEGSWSRFNILQARITPSEPKRKLKISE